MDLKDFKPTPLSTEEQYVGDYLTVGVEEKKYEQGDYGALLESMNSLRASVVRANYNEMQVDTSAYEGIEFTQEAFKKKAMEEEDGFLGTELMISNIGSWEQYERRKNYLKHYKDVQNQVQNEFSTAGMLAAGIPMALLDWDSLLINPLVKGGQAIRKGLNLQSKMARVATHAATGAVAGATSMAIYEGATGVQHEDSITNSALMGMALGGSLGMFVERASKPKDIWTSPKEGQITQEKAQSDLLNKTKAELDAIEDAISISNLIQKNVAKAKGNLKLGVAEIFKATRGELHKAKETAFTDLNKLKDEHKGFEKAFNTVNDTRKKLTSQIQKLTKDKEAFTGIEKQIADIKAKHDAYNAKYKYWKNTKLKTAKGADKEHHIKLVAEADKELSMMRKEIGTLRAKADKLWSKEKQRSFKELNAELSHTGKMLHEATKARAASKTKVEVANQEFIKANRVLKEFGRKANIDKIKDDGGKLKAMQERIEHFSAMADPAKFAEVMSKRNKLFGDLEHIKKGAFDNLDDLKGMKREKQNYIHKLEKELESTHKKLMNTTEFEKFAVNAKIPELVKKLLISPVARLQASQNPAVSGLASLLHSGTVHVGKIVARTAYRVRKEYDELLSRHTRAFEYHYTEARKNGYKKSKDEFEVEVANEIYKVTGNIQRDLSKGIPATATEAERAKIMHERIGSVQRRYSNNNEHVQKAVDEFLNYYEKIHKDGKALGMAPFQTSLGKGYATRMYSADKIRAMGREEAINRIVEAQRAYALDNALEIDLKLFKEKATTAVDASLSKEDVLNKITNPLVPRRTGSPTPFKQRGIEAYDDDLASVLSDDILANTHTYGLTMHGRLALKERLGIDTNDQLVKMMDDIGATTEEKANFTAIVETILGTREITKNPLSLGKQGVKLVSSYSSLMHTGAFGVPTLTEVASVAKEFGWKSTIQHLVPHMKDIKNIYKNGTPSDKNILELQAEYGSAYFTHRANRLDTESAFEATSKFQEKIDSAVHKLSVYGGLLPVTDLLKMTTISASVDFLAKLSVKGNKISKADRMRLQDMGFDLDDLVQIRDTLKVTPEGRITNMNRESWGDLDQRLTDGVMTMVERTILHPNGATLPKFMTDMNNDWVPKLLFKFMRFPFESYERLLVRGMQEADAKQMLGLAGNIAMWSMILKTKDVIKGTDKYEDDETQLFKDALLYNSWTSLPIAMTDKAYGAITGENLTNDYRHRVFGVVESDLTALRELNPRFSIPFYNMELGDAVARIFTDMDTLDEFARSLQEENNYVLPIDRMDPIDYSSEYQPNITKRFQAEEAKEMEDLLKMPTQVNVIIEDLYEEFKKTEGNGDTTGAAPTGSRGLTKKVYTEMKLKYGSDITEEQASKYYLQEAYNHMKSKWRNFDQLAFDVKYALMDASYNLGYTTLTSFKGLSKAITNNESPEKILINILDTANISGQTSKGLAKRRAMAWNKAASPKITSVTQESDGSITYYSNDSVIFKYGKGRGIHSSSKPGSLAV